MASFITPPGILAFPNLFVARAPVPGADPRFQAQLIFDAAGQAHPKYKELKEAVLEICREEWPKEMKADAASFLKKLRLPFRDGGEKAQYAGFGSGKIFISAWTKNKPGLVDANKNDILDPNDVFPGCISRFRVTPFPFKNSGNMGVSLGLEHVQVLKTDGMPRLDGRIAADKAFDDDEDISAYTGVNAGDDLPF